MFHVVHNNSLSVKQLLASGLLQIWNIVFGKQWYLGGKIQGDFA